MCVPCPPLSVKVGRGVASTADNILVNQQTLQPHWTTGMNTVGANADLSAKPEAEAVGESSRCVVKYSSRIHTLLSIYPKQGVVS